MCCINRFTSLCNNLLNLLEFLAEAFRCHVHHFQCLAVQVTIFSFLLAVVFNFQLTERNVRITIGHSMGLSEGRGEVTRPHGYAL